MVIGMNILIPNIGRRGYLVDYMKNTPGYTGKVFVSDCDRTASGLYGNNDGFFILSKPVDDEEKYVSELCDLCEKESIKIIIPVIDPEIDILSKYKDTFANKEISLIVSSSKVLEICYDKIKMNAFLDMIGLLHPKTYLCIDEFVVALNNGEVDYPIIIKPILGSGSVDTYLIENTDKLKALFKKGMMIQEYLKEAIEYGTDTFNTLEGLPVRTVVKKKISMRSGETDKSLTVHIPEIRDMLIYLGRKLGHIGNLDTDIMFSRGKYYIIDMNPRFGGGYPATHAAGVNLLQLIIQMVNGDEITANFDEYTDNLLVMKTISVNSVVIDNGI